MPLLLLVLLQAEGSCRAMYGRGLHAWLVGLEGLKLCIARGQQAGADPQPQFSIAWLAPRPSCWYLQGYGTLPTLAAALPRCSWDGRNCARPPGGSAAAARATDCGRAAGGGARPCCYACSLSGETCGYSALLVPAPGHPALKLTEKQEEDRAVRLGLQLTCPPTCPQQGPAGPHQPPTVPAHMQRPLQGSSVAGWRGAPSCRPPAAA